MGAIFLCCLRPLSLFFCAGVQHIKVPLNVFGGHSAHGLSRQRSYSSFRRIQIVFGTCRINELSSLGNQTGFNSLLLAMHASFLVLDKIRFAHAAAANPSRDLHKCCHTRGIRIRPFAICSRTMKCTQCNRNSAQYQCNDDKECKKASQKAARCPQQILNQQKNRHCDYRDHNRLVDYRHELHDRGGELLAHLAGIIMRDHDDFALARWPVLAGTRLVFRHHVLAHALAKRSRQQRMAEDVGNQQASTYQCAYEPYGTKPRNDKS